MTPLPTHWPPARKQLAVRLLIQTAVMLVFTLFLTYGWRMLAPLERLLCAVLGCLATATVTPLFAMWLRGGERRRLRPTPAGAETMVGELARVIESLDPEGVVRAHGEVWAARVIDGGTVDRGSFVQVVKCKEMVLYVVSNPTRPNAPVGEE